MNDAQWKADNLLRRKLASGMDSQEAVKATLDRLTSGEKAELLCLEILRNDPLWNALVRERMPR
jgi:hypothetical protein